MGRIATLFAALTISHPWGLLAQTAETSFPSASQTERTSVLEPEERVRQLARDVLEVAQLPSLSVAVLDGTQPQVTHPQGTHPQGTAPSLRFAIGHEDLDAQKPATPETRYRAASVSKLFTVTAFARMVEAGTVGWDTAVTDLLPSFPNVEGATLRQLAGHLGGIAHYRGEDRIERFVATPDVQEALAFFRESPRVGPPGAQMHYTTHGYTLLSAALEAAAGTPFLKIVAEDVAGPLGLTHTGPAWLPRELESLEGAPPPHAELYMITPGGARPFPQPESATYKWGGGGLATTPTDLVRLARAYLHPADESGFLRPETIETMWTSQAVGDQPTGTGIGWRIGRDDLDRPVRHHSGSMQGTRTVLMVDPERRDAISVMTNASWNSSIETTALLLLDSWRLPAPTRTFDGTVSTEVWIEPKNGEPGERASGTATWRDGALDLPEPADLKRRIRNWNTKIRIRPVATGPDGKTRWASITARGAGPGSCTESETWSCRFRLSHDADLRVEWRPVAEE